LESKGVKAPYSCREGVCSTCEFTLLEGEVQLHKNDVLDEDDLEDGIRLACQALPASEVVRARFR
jgi:3-ketosteroid 9alpha-monooxygenase subunit B